MATRIYFARHGQSQANVLEVISNRNDAVHPLTDLGWQQANELAERLSGRSITAVYASPLLRAVQTGRTIAERLGVPTYVAEPLREFDCGEIEGESSGAAWERHVALRRAWIGGGTSLRIPGGESLDDVVARFVPFVRTLLERHSGEAVAVVSHGGTYCCALGRLLVNVTETYPWYNGLGNCEYVLAEERAEGLTCVSWAGEVRDRYQDS